MNNSELYHLIFQCLLINEAVGFDEVFKNKIATNEKVILKFIRLSSNHLVLPAIYRVLQEKGISDLLPPDLDEHLNEILHLNIKRNEEILQQINEINLHLKEADIEPVYMKGTANLLDGLYIDKADRMIGDIDFLVKDEDFLSTADIILKLGYKTDIEIYDDIKSLKDYPRLFRDDVPADIEIHRLPVIPKYADWFNTELIFKDKREISDRINCFVPSDNHKLIQNFIHGQLTNKGYRLKVVSIRDLYDSYLLQQRINKYEVISEINEKEKIKAKIYFDFLKPLVNDDINKHELNIKSKRFITKHHWLINHPRIHYFLIKIFKTGDIITTRFLRAFVDKTTFENLFVRITKLEWWQKRLFKGLKEYFS